METRNLFAEDGRIIVDDTVRKPKKKGNLICNYCDKEFKPKVKRRGTPACPDCLVRFTIRRVQGACKEAMRRVGKFPDWFDNYDLTEMRDALVEAEELITETLNSRKGKPTENR